MVKFKVDKKHSVKLEHQLMANPNIFFFIIFFNNKNEYLHVNLRVN